MPRHRILIVDDDPGAIEAFEPMLRIHGYDVRVAADAESAFAEVERLNPHAMLVDLHLPVIDGLEFLRRSAPPDTRSCPPQSSQATISWTRTLPTKSTGSGHGCTSSRCGTRI